MPRHVNGRNVRSRSDRRGSRPVSNRPAIRNWRSQEGINERIFVQIPSYRDPECQWTLKDMFEKATNPERVFAGVVWQFIRGKDDRCFLQKTRPGQVRQKLIDARFSKGVCWARAQTQELWQGEEYTLQIDSHTRFEPDWDQKLIHLCRQTGSSKPVITCYPPAYTPPDTFYKGNIFSMGAKEFDRDGMFSMEGHAISLEDAPALPIPGMFCAAGFLFAPAAIIREVPYDPHLYFTGEEITLAVRLWTHGWDLFYPNMVIVYTNWERAYRKTHFDDHPDWPALERRSQSRVQYLLARQEPADFKALKDIEKYGLGRRRTLEEYQRYSGVNFVTRTFTDHPRDGKPHTSVKTGEL